MNTFRKFTTFFLLVASLFLAGVIFGDDIIEVENENLTKKQYSVSYTFQGNKHFAKFNTKKEMDTYLKTFSIRTNPNVSYRIVIVRETEGRKTTFIDENKPAADIIQTISMEK